MLKSITESLRKSLGEMHVISMMALGAKPGVHHAINPPVAFTVFDNYMADILGSLEDLEHADRDDAMAFMLMQADIEFANGHLPPLPEDDEDQMAAALWVGKAQVLGFKNLVLQAWKDDA